MSHCFPTTRSAGLSMELDTRGRSYDSLTPEHDPVPAPIEPPTRKSHDKKRPEGYIPRPPNAFLLYRSDFLRRKIIPREVESKQYNISTVAGECWHSLTTEEKAVWKDLAKVKEEEHARMYPDYKYAPQKREPVQRRRRTITREQEIDHCRTLRATYVPDKTGTAIQPPTTLRSKRKSRAKVRAVPKVLPPVESLGSVPTPSFDAPAFTDPLCLPPPQFQVPDSVWQKQPRAVAWVSPATVPHTLDPMAYFDFQAVSSPSSGVGTDDLWSKDPVHQSPVPEPMPTREPVPLNAAHHIREKYDIARRGAICPTPSMDSLEARAIFEHQPFFTPPASTKGAYPTTPEAQNNISSPGDFFSNFAFPQFDYAPSPPYHASDTPALQSDTPFLSVPQHFPMSLEVSGTMEPLRLQPPTFYLSSGTHNLDSLTVSLDFSGLESLEGVNGPLELFGEIDELGFGSEPGLGPMEDIAADVCLRE